MKHIYIQINITQICIYYVTLLVCVFKRYHRTQDDNGCFDSFFDNMQISSENQNPNTAFVERSNVPPKRRTDGAKQNSVKTISIPPVSSTSGQQQRHESVSTSTVDLNGRPNKNADSRTAIRPDSEISFDQLIDAINFSNVDRAAAQERDLNLALNLYALPTNHSWADSNKHQPSRNLFFASPSARELGTAKRSSGSGHSSSSSSQQQPIKDVHTERRTPSSQVPTSSSTKYPSHDSNSRNRSRFFDIESTNPTSSASLFNPNIAASPRFAAISSGIKRKGNNNNPSKHQSNDHHGNPEHNKPSNACSQQPKLASTELFLLPTAGSASSPPSSSSIEDANNIRMVVCSLSGMIDGNSTPSANAEASRYLQVGVFYI